MATSPSPLEEQFAQEPLAQQAFADASGTQVRVEPPVDPGVERLNRMNFNIAQADKQQSSFLPQALAIGAMLTGNFGPMIQMQEQKRKTAIAKLVNPVVAEASKFAAEGRHQEAMNLMQQASDAAGIRAPELTAAFKPVLEDLRKKEYDWRNLKFVSDTYKDSVSDDDPVLGPFKRVLARAVKERTPVAESVLASMSAKMAAHTQIIDGKLVRVGAGGQMQTQPIPAIFDEKMVGGPVGETLSAKLGIGLPDMQNILNLKPGTSTVLADGSTVAHGSPEYRKVVELQQAGAPLRAGLGFEEKIPKEASVVSAMKANGATSLQLATGTSSAKAIDAGIIADQARKVQVSAAAALTQIEQDPIHAERAGLVNMDADTGLPLRRGITIKEIREKGINVIRLPVDTFNKQYAPNMEALTALNNMEPLITALGNPKTYGERFASWANRFGSSLTGIALAPGIAAGKHFEIVLNNAIEQAATRYGISHNDTNIQELKAYVTGKGNDQKQAREAVTYIQKRLADRIYRETGEKSLSQPQIPGQTTPATTTQPGTTPAPAAPGTPGQESPTSTFSKQNPKGRPRNKAQQQAVDILNPIISPETAATPTPATPTPATPKKRSY